MCVSNIRRLIAEYLSKKTCLSIETRNSVNDEYNGIDLLI